MKRYDSVELTERASRTQDGYLQGRAIFTRVGVFRYQQPDGTVRRELRAPNEVLDPDSLETMRLMPMTNGHPDSGLVTSENAKETQVGYVGESIESDSYVIAGPFRVTDGETIADVEAGKTSLSCGYEADVIEESGEWLGMEYDAVQRNIRYNHLAIVDQARAGVAARISMDAADAVCVGPSEQKQRSDRMSENMKKITLDGVEYQAEAPVVQTLNRLRADYDELEGNSVRKDDYTKLEAERDSLQERVDALESEKAELEQAQPDTQRLDELVKERGAVLSVASKVIGDEADTKLGNEELKREVVKARGVNVDERDDVYIQARFDAIVEELEREPAKRQKEQVLSPHTDGRSAEDADSARQRMIDAKRNAYRDKYGRNHDRKNGKYKQEAK